MCGIFRNLQGAALWRGNYQTHPELGVNSRRRRPGYQEEFPSVLAEALHTDSELWGILSLKSG